MTFKTYTLTLKRYGKPPETFTKTCAQYSGKEIWQNVERQLLYNNSLISISEDDKTTIIPINQIEEVCFDHLPTAS